MNKTSRIKSARQQPHYVLNFSIDIPFQSKYLLNQKGVTTSTKVSPKKQGRTSVTPLRRIVNNGPCLNFSTTRKNLSACVQKNNIQVDNHPNYRKSLSQGRAPSMQIIPKKVKKKSVIKSAREAPNLLKQFDSQNSVIRYTNNSNQSAFRMADQNINHLLLQFIGQSKQSDNLFLSGLNVDQIRKYQRIATQRKQHLKYNYIKQSVLAQASAKKIQRAWRKYQTSKLISSYSSRGAVKWKFPLPKKVQQQHQSSISSRSSRKIGKMQIIDMEETPHLTRVQKKHNSSESLSQNYQNFDSIEIYTKTSPFYKTSKQNDLQNQQISQEIKKWDDLINQIRSGKSLNEVLQKSYQRRAQLQKAIFNLNNNLNSEQQSINSGDSFDNSSGERKNIADYQQKIRKIHQQIKKKEDEQNQQLQRRRQQGQMNIDQGKKQQLTSRRQKQYKESQQIKAQLKLLSDLQSLRQKNETDQWELTMKKELDIQKQISGQKTQKIRPIHLKQFSENIRPEVTLRSPKKNQEQLQKNNNKNEQIENKQQKQQEFKKSEKIIQGFQQPIQQINNVGKIKNQLKLLSIIQSLQFCKMLMEDLIYECLLDYASSQKIVNLMKSLFQKKKTKQQKWEGICTNVQSIKDYLQNLVSYILDYYIAQSMDALNTSFRSPPLSLLKSISNNQFFQRYDLTQNMVLPMKIFQQHWSYVSDQIYFDKKFDDQQQQIARVNHLKSLTRIYFHSIFDGFNQSLQFYRSFGLTGKPYPWKSSHLNQKYSQIKVCMKQAYQRILSVSMIFCGLHLEGKKQKMPENVIKEIQQERLRYLINVQMQEDDIKWQYCWTQPHQANLLCLISIQIQKELMKQLLQDLSVYRVFYQFL